MNYQAGRLVSPTDTSIRATVIGYTRDRDVRIDFGNGRSISSDLFYAAWQTAFDWKVSTSAVMIRNGRITQGVRRLQSSVILLDSDEDRIVKRLRHRETSIVSDADLATELLTLTVRIGTDEYAFEATLSDEDCEELDFVMRTMERKLARHETFEEFKERLAEEAAEDAADAASAAPIALPVAAE